MKNKREIIIAIVSLIVGATLTFLIINNKQTFSAIQTTTTTNSTPTTNWKTYVNSRFGFSIKYPINWPLEKESTNGDGLALLKDSSGNEVLVYASNVPDTFSNLSDPVDHKELILDDGSKATALKSKDKTGKINYIMFFNLNENQEGKQFVLYATVTEQFFKENEQILQAVAKSFTLLSKPSSQTSNDIKLDIERVKQEGYTVLGNPETTYYPSDSLSVLIGMCTGSADGYCNKAFFFYNGKYLGTDSSDSSIGIEEVWQTDKTVALYYRLYRKNDSLCCSTAGAALVRFQWDGTKLKALDPIPTSDWFADIHR